MVSAFVHYGAGAPAGRLATIMNAGARRAFDDPRDRLVSVEIPEDLATQLSRFQWVTRVNVHPTTVHLMADVLSSGVQSPNDQLPWGVDYTNADYVRTKYNDIGANVKVAIIDNGIDCNHPDLTVAGGFDFYSMSDDFCAGGSHGTPVAGIIAAQVNDVDVIGMAPGVSLYSLRVCGPTIIEGYILEACTDAALHDALQWAIDNGMKVVNMSLGNCGEELSQELQDKIVAAYNAGITLVGAAGNGPHSGFRCAPTAPVAKPAAHPMVIAVTAHYSYEAQPTDFQYGPEVDIAAPTNVRSDQLGGGTGNFGGTSAAAPHVSGAAALVIGRGLVTTPSTVRSALQLGAKDLGPAGWDDHYGHGALRADWSTIPVARVTAIAGPTNFTSPSTANYVATVQQGDAPIQLQWRVQYINNGVTTDYTSPWSSSTSFGYLWPAGNYTAQLTATPKETLGRIGFAGIISIVVCTNPLPVAFGASPATGGGGTIPMAKSFCAGGPPPPPPPRF
jgi:subtilisin family serine protease